MTQALHIPPQIDTSNEPKEEINAANAKEVERLKSDMRKLKDYLKTSVQERKALVKKIGTLRDRVTEAHVRQSVSPEKSTMTEFDRSFEEMGIQCNLLDDNNEESNFNQFAHELDNEVLNEDAKTSVPPNFNRLNISDDSVARLETILLQNENSKEKIMDLLENFEASDVETGNCYRLNVPNVTNCYKRRSYLDVEQYDDNSRMSSECLQNDESTPHGENTQDGNASNEMALIKQEPRSCSSMASSLPDPNTIDLLELSFDNNSPSLQGLEVEALSSGCPLALESPYQPILQDGEDTGQAKRLGQELERKRRDLEHKSIVLDALEQQNQEKDKIIRDQADVLEEYRMEILKMREEKRELNSGRVCGQQSYTSQSKKRHPRRTLSADQQQVRIRNLLDKNFFNYIYTYIYTLLK